MINCSLVKLIIYFVIDRFICILYKLLILLIDYNFFLDGLTDGSLTDLLMNDTDLYDDTIQSNPTILAPVQNEVVPRLKKSQRTKNFSVEEDKLIVSAWLNTSKDAITENEQQGGAFWQRILQCFELHGGNHGERSQSSIKRSLE